MAKYFGGRLLYSNEGNVKASIHNMLKQTSLDITDMPNEISHPLWWEYDSGDLSHLKGLEYAQYTNEGHLDISGSYQDPVNILKVKKSGLINFLVENRVEVIG
jgi:hypothetical protein